MRNPQNPYSVINLLDTMVTVFHHRNFCSNSAEGEVTVLGIV